MSALNVASVIVLVVFGICMLGSIFLMVVAQIYWNDTDRNYKAAADIYAGRGNTYKKSKPMAWVERQKWLDKITGGDR